MASQDLDTAALYNALYNAAFVIVTFLLSDSEWLIHPKHVPA